MASRYNKSGEWRKIGTVIFSQRPHIIFMSNDDKLWGLAMHYSGADEPKGPASIRSIGNFEDIDLGFARDAKPVIEAALWISNLNSDPSVSPNAKIA